MHNFIIRIFKPRPIYAKWLLFILCLGIIVLSFMDFLQPIENFLSTDRFSFNVGSIRLTLFMIIKGIITIIVLLWVTGIISDFAENKIKGFRNIKSSNKSLLIKIIQITIYFVAFLILLDLLNIDLTTLAVFSGAIGIGLGFGLQKITSNFISGLILLFEKSIEDSDLIELNDGIYGTVRKISARYTLVETYEGKEIMIPNEDFVTNRVTNWTYSNNKGRIGIKIGVSYKSDIEKARELILEAAREHPRCSSDPEPECYLREFGDSSVDFLLFFWVDDIIEGRFRPQSEVLFSIWNKFKKNNIEIPFPQRDVYIKEAPKSGSIK